MCDPATIGLVTFGLGALQTGLSYVGQNQAAKANEKSANLTAANEFNTRQQQATELDQAKSERAVDTAITTAQSEGAISASASERGLGSQSLIQSLNASMFGIGRNASIEDLNDQNQRVQLGNEATGSEIRRQSRINSVQKGNPLSLVLGVGGAALSGATAYSNAGGRLGGK